MNIRIGSRNGCSARIHYTNWMHCVFTRDTVFILHIICVRVLGTGDGCSVIIEIYYICVRICLCDYLREREPTIIIINVTILL